MNNYERISQTRENQNLSDTAETPKQDTTWSYFTNVQNRRRQELAKTVT